MKRRAKAVSDKERLDWLLKYLRAEGWGPGSSQNWNLGWVDTHIRASRKRTK